MRILVVEDDDFKRLEILNSLEKDGHTVDDFDNVPDALKALKINRYDFVLSDLNLPNVDGLDFLERTKGDPPFILYTTGREVIGIASLAKQAGALLFITNATIPNLIQRSFDAFKESVENNTKIANSI